MSGLRRIGCAGVIACALASAGCGSDDEGGEGVGSGGQCYQKLELSTAELCAMLDGACPAAGEGPEISDYVTVVPGPGLPDGVNVQDANNNLDIAWFRGRLFFAFRTAPDHFASHLVEMYIVSTADQKTWTLERKIYMEKDLREPRFLTIGDELYMYFAVLSDRRLTFVPLATMMTKYDGPCEWSEPEEVLEPGFIPWRGREIDGTSYVIGYLGGEDIYSMEGGLGVHLLKTEDGKTFSPAAGDDGVVMVGGASETDFAVLDDGTLVAVARNEAGENGEWGSKICRAEAGAWEDWTCKYDKKKYDSPLVFEHRNDVYLIGRRHVTESGNFDLELDDLSESDQLTKYQAQYWSAPKRCSLWKVDPTALNVELVLDLPSKGDTCFASVVPLNERQYLVYNYSSPPDGEDYDWIDGQLNPTIIYRLTLTLP